MLSLQEVLSILQGYIDEDGIIHPGMDLNEFRIRTIQALAEKTQRNVVTYYSGFLAYKESNTDVNDTDINGFVNAIQPLDPSKGVDLIIHSPGGDPDAAEGIVKYFHQVFGNDVRVIVPQSAFSAGTMISCSAKTILMGKYSCLGPIDPQLNGIPASDMLQEMNAAKRDLKKDPSNFSFWRMRIGQNPPGFYFYLMDAIKLSTLLVTEWLTKYMFFEDEPEVAAEKAKKIVKKLNANNKSHGRHFTYDFCKDLGLNVELLEDDPELESLVLNLHTAYTLTFNNSNASKIIENHLGDSYITADAAVEEAE